MWTKKSYDALFDWIDVAKRDNVRNVLRADGLADVVARMDAAKTLGVWNSITLEAAAAVGSRIVESVADHANQALQSASASTRLPPQRGGNVSAYLPADVYHGLTTSAASAGLSINAALVLAVRMWLAGGEK